MIRRHGDNEIKQMKADVSLQINYTYIYTQTLDWIDFLVLERENKN